MRLRCLRMILLTVMISLCGDSGASEDGILPDEWSLLREVFVQLEQRGLDVDSEKIERAVVNIVLKAVDSGATLCTDEEREEFASKRNGYRRCAGLLVEVGDPHPLVSDVLHSGEIPIGKGDAIESINGSPTEDKNLLQIYRQLRGYDEEPLDIVFSRRSESGASTAKVEQVSVRMPALMLRESLPRHISYIKLRGIYGDMDGVNDAIASGLEKEESLGTIIDLRGAAGNNLDKVLDTTELLGGEKGTIFKYENLATGEVQDYVREKAAGNLPPVVVLIDGETSGASEVFASACKANGSGAILLGEETGGDPLLRDFKSISSGENLFLLARKMTVPGGGEYDGIGGVLPDIKTSSYDDSARSSDSDYNPFYKRKSAEGEKINRRLAERLGDDAVLRRAVELLLGLEALGLN